MKKRLGIISFFVVIFITFIIIWNYSYQKGKEEAYIPIIETPDKYYIPSESGAFKRFDNLNIDYSNIPIDENHQRTLESYYDNRAYPGAPPSIPHPVSKERSLGGNTCIQCHQSGGFVEKYSAYAPVTPHPEMINCRQCHVTKNTNTTFKAFDFVKAQPPKIGKGVNNVMPGSPPMIPHQLQLRENCISCHAGSSAPKEIRVTHPERINCRQCHLPIINSEQQPMNAKEFIRQYSTTNDQ